MPIPRVFPAFGRQVTDDENQLRGSFQSDGSLAFSGQRWGLIAVEAMEAGWTRPLGVAAGSCWMI